MSLLFLSFVCFVVPSAYFGSVRQPSRPSGLAGGGHVVADLMPPPVSAAPIVYTPNFAGGHAA